MKSHTKSKQVRVYVEAGVTLQVNEFEFLRYTFGHERLAENDSEAAIRRAEAKAYELCEERIEKRVKKLRRIIRASKA